MRDRDVDGDGVYAGGVSRCPTRSLSLEQSTPGLQTGPGQQAGSGCGGVVTARLSIRLLVVVGLENMVGLHVGPVVDLAVAEGGLEAASSRAEGRKENMKVVVY